MFDKVWDGKSSYVYGAIPDDSLVKVKRKIFAKYTSFVKLKEVAAYVDILESQYINYKW